MSGHTTQQRAKGDCEAGESWLIRLAGSDDDRRGQIAAIAQIAGFDGIRVPGTGEPVPNYLGWILADDTPNYRNSVPDLLAETGAQATVDSHLLSLASLLREEVPTSDIRGSLQLEGLHKETRFANSAQPSGLLGQPKPNPDNSNRTLFEAIGALDLRIQPNPSVRVAIVDDGVAPHPDLIGSVTHAGRPSSNLLRPLGRKVLAASDIAWNVTENPCYGTHGTMMAGVIGARSAGGAIGLFPGTPIDAWSPAGNCAGRETSCPMCRSALQFTSTVRAAIVDGARVVNVSLTPKCEDMGHAIWRDTIAYALRKNAVVVIAAGNMSNDLDATCLRSLRQYPNVLIATSSIGNAVAFNYGAETVSLAVPFDSPIRTTSKDPDPPSDFGYTSGIETSFAAAITSAATAMVMAHPRYLHANAGDVVAALLEHARKNALDPAKPIDPRGGILSLDFLR